MGRLKGKRIDFLLGYYVLITLVNLKYKSLQIYKMHQSSLVSWLPQSSGWSRRGVPQPSSSIHHGGFIPFPEASWRHLLGVPHKKMAELRRRAS